MLKLIVLLLWSQMAHPIDIIAAGQSNMLYPALHESFKVRMRELGVEVNIIECARGGYSIRWWRRMWATRHAYGDCLAKAPNAVGMIWWQGEADTGRLDTWKQGHEWLERFGQMIADMRQDLGRDIPVAFARLGNQRTDPGWRAIRDQQEQFNMPGTIMVSVDGIQYKEPTLIHATEAGYMEAGRRFADAFFELYSARQ